MAVRAHTQTTVTKQVGQACPSLGCCGGGKEGLDFSLSFKTKILIPMLFQKELVHQCYPRGFSR